MKKWFTFPVQQSIIFHVFSVRLWSESSSGFSFRLFSFQLRYVEILFCYLNPLCPRFFLFCLWVSVLNGASLITAWEKKKRWRGKANMRRFRLSVCVTAAPYINISHHFREITVLFSNFLKWLYTTWPKVCGHLNIWAMCDSRTRDYETISCSNWFQSFQQMLNRCRDLFLFRQSQVLPHQIGKTISLFLFVSEGIVMLIQERDEHKLLTQTTLLSKTSFFSWSIKICYYWNRGAKVKSWKKVPESLKVLQRMWTGVSTYFWP